MRLIDADALEQAADKAFEHIDSPLLNHLTTYDVYSLINNAPTVDIPNYGGRLVPDPLVGWRYVERPQGKWIYAYTNGFGNRVGFCSVCENSCSPSNFCPNCGADMRGKENEDSN